MRQLFALSVTEVPSPVCIKASGLALIAVRLLHDLSPQRRTPFLSTSYPCAPRSSADQCADTFLMYSPLLHVLSSLPPPPSPLYPFADPRRIFVFKLARMYTINAINIQRVGRGHIARKGKVRDVLEANHAARVITRAIRTYIVNQARLMSGSSRDMS